MEKLLTIIDGPRLSSCAFFRRQMKDKKNKKLQVHLEQSSKIGIGPAKDMLSITWSVHSDSPGLPFKFAIEVEGLFKMAKKLTKNEIVDATKKEAGALLFVALRDIVADLTQKAELTPLYLSYPNFDSLRAVQKKTANLSREKTKSTE